MEKMGDTYDKDVQDYMCIYKASPTPVQKGHPINHGTVGGCSNLFWASKPKEDIPQLVFLHRA